MSEHSNGNNVYKPKLTGFLIAAVALLVLVVVLLVSTILILTLGPKSGDNTQNDSTESDVLQNNGTQDPSTTTAAPDSTDDPDTTDTPDNPDNPDVPIIPDNPDDPDVPSVPVDPNRVPTKVSPDEITLTLPQSEINEGSLLLLDDDHPYQKDPTTLISRGDMSKLSADKLLENYGFVRVTASSGNYSIKDANIFLNADAYYYFNEMMKDYVKEKGHTDVQIRNAYYYTSADDNESVEHATGYYIDLQIFRSNGSYPLNYETMKNDYYNWFVDNCWKYGFVHVRDIAGKYSSFRFVGAAHAAVMNKFGLDHSQYLSAITVYSYAQPLKVTDGFGWEWWIYYVKSAGELTSFTTLGNEDSYHVSGNNTDGYIIAINTSCFA